MHYDLIVIGGGPAGYVAAERAGAKGLRVLLVEQAQLGGVCLNCGCIPSKIMLNAAKRYYDATHGEAFGVLADGVTFDWERAQAHQRQVIETLRKGVAGLMKQHRVDVLAGTALLRPDRAVAVGDAIYTSTHVLLATGFVSRPPADSRR